MNKRQAFLFFRADQQSRRQGQIRKDFHVFRVERTATFVEDLKNPQAAAGGVDHGYGEKITGRETSAAIDFRIKTRIIVRIGEIDELAGPRDAARNTRADGKANLGLVLAQGQLGPKLAAPLVD